MSNSPSSSNKPSISDIDWYAIACKIRTQNQKLKQKITILETLIQEQKQQIKVQVFKNQDYDHVINEKEEQVIALENDYEEQIAKKEQQIETQQLTINQITQELEKIQQQAARLERECSLLQENYNEQQNELQKIEIENKDLRIRLQRQQRYNLQYKTALDKFLDTSSQNNHDFNSLGIKSWSDSDLEEENIEGDNEHIESDVWEYQSSSTNTETEATEDSSSLSEKSEENDVAENRQSTTESDSPKEKKVHNKLSLKLPQFGFRKKNIE